MAIDSAKSIEEQLPKSPDKATKQQIIPPFTHFDVAKFSLTNISENILRSFKGLSAKPTRDVNLGAEAIEIKTLSDELDALSKTTEAKLQVPQTVATVDTNSGDAEHRTPSVVSEKDNITVAEVKTLSPNEYAPFTQESIERIFTEPTRVTYTTLTYEAKATTGDELSPQKRMLYKIPVQYNGRVIRDIILKHRKDPSRFSGDGWDPDGAYSRVLIKDTKTGEWKAWIDPAGYGSDKFAEPRSAFDPENEVLHDWLTTVGEVRPTIISVANVGKTERAISNIHGIEVVFFPENEGISYQQQIFSSGTEFVDLDKHRREPRYGGGPNYGGKYPGAIALGGWGRVSEGKTVDNDPTKSEYIDEQGRMHIKLEPGKKFVNLELAVGDTHPDGIGNKDGHIGTLGWAKIYASIKSPGQEDDRYFMRNVNVPPAGVLAGGPEQVNRIVTDGEELIIESRSDIAYLMGYRVAYKED